ncbi:MAG: enoyl-CoA hydratase/isomerase family protein, partial [Chloroflexi bacterium]|nr:enoyl-CoA hydratase/isomerase family protein [Chloroflexota bacterium]
RQAMVERKWLGNKTGQGFYKEMKGAGGQREFWALDLNTLEYKPPAKVRFESVGKAKDVEPLGERLKVLVGSDDRAGAFVWRTLSFSMAYAARRVPEIANEFYPIDNAMKWGFMREMGPFEMWDALGVAETVARMEADGTVVAPWVKAMLARGCASFYQRDVRQAHDGDAVGYYDWQTQSYQPLPSDPDVISLRRLKAQGKELAANESASVVDLGDGVLCLEFHTKTMNAIDQHIVEMFQTALDEVAKPAYAGLVIGNEGENFCAGANLFMVAMGAQQQQFDQLEGTVARFQSLLQRIRFSPKPVVAAPFGMTLAGGAEIVLACPRVVAHSETYMGLVEVGVGLVPSGGGIKEMLRRVLSPVMRTPQVNPQPFYGKVFQTISQAKVSASAHEAQSLGFLSEHDRIVFSRDRLIGEAKRTVLQMAADRYRAPIASKSVYAVGRDGLAGLKLAVNAMRTGHYVSDYDVAIARQLVNVIAGGDLSAGQWVDEQYILDLEREAFIELCKQPKTVERMWGFLQTGKPVRN